MKTVVINASPRKKWNTAEIMQSAQKGAESVGAETEYINLYDVDFKGCRSCLVCKLKGKEKCKCYWRDNLSPIIEGFWQLTPCLSALQYISVSLLLSSGL